MLGEGVILGRENIYVKNIHAKRNNRVMHFRTTSSLI